MTAGPSLTDAAITFTTSSGGKRADTALSVQVSTRVLTTLNILLAHRKHFADSDTWDDAGSEQYSYPLETTPIVPNELASDIDVRVEWIPASQADCCTLAYDLDLTFTDGSGDAMVLNHHVDGVTVDQQNRLWTSAISLSEARQSLRLHT
jgi:hypothetical protein